MKNTHHASDGSGHHVRTVLLSCRGALHPAHIEENIFPKPQKRLFYEPYRGQPAERSDQITALSDITAERRKKASDQLSAVRSFRPAPIQHAEDLIQNIILDLHDKRRHIGIMIIKGAPRHACPLRHLGDGDLLRILFQAQKFKGVTQILLRLSIADISGCLIHSTNSGSFPAFHSAHQS